MKNFDEARHERAAAKAAEFGDKPFTFAGEVFHVRPDVGYVTVKRVAEINDSTPGAETFDAVEDAVLAMLDPRDDALDRFLAATRQKDDPVTFDDLLELYTWLLEETSGRPPTQPEPPADMPPATGTSSTEISSTEQASLSVS